MRTAIEDKKKEKKKNFPFVKCPKIEGIWFVCRIPYAGHYTFYNLTHKYSRLVF